MPLPTASQSARGWMPIRSQAQRLPARVPNMEQKGNKASEGLSERKRRRVSLSVPTLNPTQVIKAHNTA